MKWIDTEFSKPDEGTFVLVAVRQDEGPAGVSYCVTTGVRIGNVFWHGPEAKDAAIENVTHWMPFQHPPHNNAIHADGEKKTACPACGNERCDGYY